MRIVSLPSPRYLLACLLVAACTRTTTAPSDLITFDLGVASGDVTSRAAALWTRVDGPAALTVQVAEDPAFPNIVLERAATALARDDFTAQVVVQPLQPDTTYYYRWTAGKRVSRTGRFHTAPLPSAAADLRFAFSGDSDGVTVAGAPYYGPFQVLDAVRRDQPSFFVYLGDTIYADSMPRQRILGQAPARELDELRALYRANRRFEALRELTAATSIYPMWDDHEVINDYAGQTVDPQRYANGRKAFLEYMPLRQDLLVRDEQCAGAPLFRSFRWGQDVELFIPDLRSCRSGSVEERCQSDFAPTLPAALRRDLGLGPTPPEGCLDALHDPSRTMLGPVQKALLESALAGSRATYKIVMSEVPIQQLYALPYDRWEGYPAERSALLSFIRAQNIQGVVFLSTDTHASLVNEVFIDRFTDPHPVAQELVTGPIATITLEEHIIEVYGPRRLAQFRQILDLARVSCRNLDTYSYGLVEIDAATDTMQVILKDRSGAPIRDERDSARTCRLTLDA